MAYISSLRRNAAPVQRLSLLTRVQNAMALRRQRRALAQLDARALADVGITQSDAKTEAQRPVWDVPGHWLR